MFEKSVDGAVQFKFKFFVLYKLLCTTAIVTILGVLFPSGVYVSRGLAVVKIS